MRRCKHSVYLIGDAGLHTKPGGALQLLQKQIENDPDSTVIFLGDNVYPTGLIVSEKPTAKSIESKKKLISQLGILRNYCGQVYFIPGNHDWRKNRIDGLKSIRAEEEYIEDYLSSNANIRNHDTGVFFPKNGLPGPVSLRIAEGLTLVIIDTQWWLQKQPFVPVGQVENLTRKKTHDLFFAELERSLAAASKRGDRIIVTGHHPLFTNGEHAKALRPWSFIMNQQPLKMIGLLGLHHVLVQNLKHPTYKKLIKNLLRILNQHKNIVYASGHEHSLQYFKINGNHHLVSGAGSKFKALRKQKIKSAYFNDDQTGFFKVMYDDTGGIRVQAYGSKAGGIMFDEIAEN
jgi:hypothetical protein